jgi:hypothetical protein
MNRLLAALPLVVLVAGCNPPAPGSSARSTPSSAAKAADKPILGKKLKTLLLPASAMPKGYKVNADGVRNSGDTVAPSSTTAVPRAQLCGSLMATSWIRASAIDSATFAQNDYSDPSLINQVAQELDGFHPGDAQKAMKGLRTALRKCASFTDKSDQMTAKIKIVTVPLKTGDDALKATVTTPAWEGGMTLVAIRIGDSIVTVFCSTAKDGGKAAAPMAKQLAKNLTSA